MDITDNHNNDLKEQLINNKRNKMIDTGDDIIDINLNNDKIILFEEEENFKERQFKENHRIIEKLKKVCLFCFVFMCIELVGGYVANSLAVMTDAAHLLSDLSGFFISMISLYIALRPADNKLSYGYHRAEVIGSLISISIIWLLTIWLIYEAVLRLFNPKPIKALLMLSIACLGLLFNIIMAKILMGDSEIVNKFEDESHSHISENKIVPSQQQDDNNGEENNLMLNSNENPVLRATYIHILGDMIQSLGVVIAATLIYFLQDSYPMAVRIDPICTFVFGIIVVSTSLPVSRDCINVLMEACPTSIKQDEIVKEFKKIPDIVDFHDIHIWCLSIGKTALTAHFISNNPQKTLEIATEICKNHGIYHSTIQVEDYRQRRRNSFKICTHLNDNQIH